MSNSRDLGLCNDKIVSVERTSGTGEAGTIDVYTITLKSGSTYNFSVTNGNNGAGGSPAGVYDTLAEIRASYPTGNNNIYIVSANGHWYYWKEAWGDSGWKDGGVYQATAIADNSVTKEKIVTGLIENITLENKLIDTYIINKDSVTTKAGLYSYSGEYYSNYSNYKCVALDISNCNYIEWTQLITKNWPFLVYVKNGQTFEVTGTNTGLQYLDLTDVQTLYINFFGDEYCADFKLVKNGTTLKLSNKIVVNKNNIAYRQGVFFRIDNYNSEYTDHQCSYVLDCSNLKSITFNSQVNPVADIYWKDKNNNFYSSPTNQSGLITIDVSNAVQIAFNFRDEENKSYVITFKETLLNKYKHYNNKGFIFNNTKLALFVGDSITAGYTSEVSTTVNGYPKLFSDHYGMTYYNEAVGGAEYCEDGEYQGNIIPRMLTQITNSTHKNVDYLFIAGGKDDWGRQKNLSTFKQAVSDTIDYSLANYPNAQIILITPINANTSFNDNATDITIQEYRNVITEVAIAKDSSRITVVQGNEFDFPDETNDSSYISQMFGDGSYPSELGYRTAYLYGLIDALD